MVGSSQNDSWGAHCTVFLLTVLSLIPVNTQMIVKPMSLHNIRTRVDAGEYSSLTEFASDFVLMCKNAIVYNENDTDFHIEARRLLAEGMKEIERFHWSEITAGEVSRHRCVVYEYISYFLLGGVYAVK